jgi:hypothetical protein
MLYGSFFHQSSSPVNKLSCWSDDMSLIFESEQKYIDQIKSTDAYFSSYENITNFDSLALFQLFTLFEKKLGQKFCKKIEDNYNFLISEEWNGLIWNKDFALYFCVESKKLQKGKLKFRIKKIDNLETHFSTHHNVSFSMIKAVEDWDTDLLNMMRVIQLDQWNSRTIDSLASLGYDLRGTYHPVFLYTKISNSKQAETLGGQSF